MLVVYYHNPLLVMLFKFCSNTVNLLTAIPSVCYEKLAIPINLVEKNSNDSEVPSDSIYEGYNMIAVDILLDFLYQRLDKVYGRNFVFKHLSEDKTCFSLATNRKNH